MKELSVSIRNLSKVYSYNPKINQNLRERFFDNGDMPSAKNITALQNINIDVGQGSVLGIIGDNGSGKSTLLKIISGITHPTTGTVEISGRVASILEVGTGFHPDLTGKENIFLSGALMGMSKDEISEKYDTIVNFSEIGNYIDMAVKHYSSGMFMRLAFSVVAHLNSDLILLDEVFSVGDFSFRQKSLKKVIELSKSNRTLILVSHDLNSLERVCDHILHLQSGRMVDFGQVTDVVSKYVEKKILSTIAKEQVSIGGLEKEGEFEGNTLSKGEEVAKAMALETILKASNEIDKIKTKYEDEFTRMQRETQALKSKLEATTKKEKKLSENFTAEKVWKDGVSDSEGLFKLHKISCESDRNDPPVFEYADSLTMKCRFEKTYEGRAGLAFLVLHNLEEQVFVAYSGYSKDGVLEDFNAAGKYDVSCGVPSHMFNAGIYSISIFFIGDDLEEKFARENSIFFKIKENKNMGEEHIDNGKFSGPLKPSFHWNIKTV